MQSTPYLLLMKPLAQRLDRVPVAVLMAVVLNQESRYLKTKEGMGFHFNDTAFKQHSHIVPQTPAPSLTQNIKI